MRNENITPLFSIVLSVLNILQPCHCVCKRFEGLDIIENVVMVPSNTDILLPERYTCIIDSGREVVANEEICLNITEQGKEAVRLPCIAPGGNTMNYTYYVRETFLKPTTFTWWMQSNGVITAETTIVHYDNVDNRIVADFEYGRNISVLIERALRPYADIAVWKVNIEIGDEYVASWNDHEDGYLRCHVNPAYQDLVSLLANSYMVHMTLQAGCEMSGRFHLTETLLSTNVEEAKSVSTTFTFLLRPIGHTDIEIIHYPDLKRKLAVLRCHIHDFGNNLRYLYKWYKKTPYHTEEVSADKTLVISDFSYANTGKYYCTASYECVEESSGIVELIVNGDNKLPLSPTTSRIPVNSNEKDYKGYNTEAQVRKTVKVVSKLKNEGNNVVVNVDASLPPRIAAGVIAVIVIAAMAFLCVKRRWNTLNPFNQDRREESHDRVIEYQAISCKHQTEKVCAEFYKVPGSGRNPTGRLQERPDPGIRVAPLKGARVFQKHEQGRTQIAGSLPD